MKPWPIRVAVGSALLTLTLGLTVLAGWFLHAPTLVQLRPQLPPMVRNTAACFTLCGLALLLASLRSSRWLVVVCTGIVSALSALTIGEYAFRVNTGIDEMLGPASIGVRVWNPGRMAPALAISFALGSIGLLLAPKIRANHSTLLLGLIGSIIVAVGMATSLASALGASDAFGWGHITRTGFHTSAGLWLLGCGLAALAWHVETDPAGGQRWLPFGVALGLATSAIGVWQALIGGGQAPFALLPAVVLAGGCLMAPTFGLTIYMAQSARAQAAALRRSETRKTAIMESALDCIVTIDQEGCITEFNPAAESTFGYHRDDVVGRHLVDVIIPQAFREKHRRGFAHYLATGEARVIGKHIEVTAIRADGNEFPVELTITRIPLDGPPCFTGFLRDITNRKQAEAELRRSEADLRQAQADLAHVTRVTTMEQLAASIAHEVNQPITGVMMNGNACLRWLAQLKDTSESIMEAREALQRIVRDGKRAGEIVARIRALSKKTEIAKEPLDLNEAIREVIVLARGEMGKQRVEMRLELPSDLPRVLGDRVQMQQVMLNLTLNAIEAMATVEGRPRDLVIATQRREEREVLVSVRDSGPGLDPSNIDRVFTAFHTTKPTGLGMGLYICRSIVQRHSGQLWATANDGPGATFQFTLLAA